MILKKISATAVAGLLTLGFAAPVAAQEALSGTEAIAKRQELMKSNGMSLRGAGQEPGPNAVAAAETIIGNFEMLAGLWPEDSMEGDTKALPVIWEDMEGFHMAFNNAETAAAVFLEAAKGDDPGAYQTAFRGLGGACGACHQKYQAD